MKYFVIIFFCLLGITTASLSSCSGCIEYKPPNNQSQIKCDAIMKRAMRYEDISHPGPVYIVLCDFTASMDPGSIAYVKESAQTIFDKYYGKATIKFYPVTKASIRPMYENVSTKIDSERISQVDFHNYERCLYSSKEAIAKGLTVTLDSVSAAHPHETYIIQSVENAIHVINAHDPKHTAKNRIFILSDMLEYQGACASDINLEDGEYQRDLRLLDTAYGISNPSIDNYIDINIAYYSNGKLIKLRQLTTFWNIVFKKLGYSTPIELRSELKF